MQVILKKKDLLNNRLYFLLTKHLIFSKQNRKNLVYTFVIY